MDPRWVEEKAELVALCSLPGISNRCLKELLTMFGSPAGAWDFLTSGSSLSGIAGSMAGRWREHVTGTDPCVDLQKMRDKGIGTVVLGEGDYPDLLCKIYDPPWVLFYRGQLPPSSMQAVSIVGSRRANPYGLEVARAISREIAQAGVIVVSGAAYGIDSAAHRGALEGRGRTIAVLGCGVDVVYPRPNRELIEKITCRGCLLSEYPSGTPPLKYHFPARNRIIAGIARGVVVVEASKTSGALITADFALADGRDVFAVPGQIFCQNSQGTNALIKKGAVPATCARDILDELGLEVMRSPDPVNGALDSPGPEDRELLEAINRGLSDVEELAGYLRIDTTRVISRLSRMEVAGMVRRGPGGLYYPASTSI